jgi:hypothetical protein
MFLYIYGDYFELYVPGKVEGLISGENLLNTPYCCMQPYFSQFLH